MIKKIFFIILNLIILFTPNFIFIPKWTWGVSLLGVVVLFDKKAVKAMGILNKYTIRIFGFWAISFSLSLLVILFQQTYDLSYTIFLIGILLAIFRGIFVSYIGVKFLNISIIQYIKVFINTCLIYLAITFVFVLFPSLKNFWFNYIIVPVSVASPELYPLRIGIEGFAGFSSAQVFSVALLLNTFLVSSRWYKSNLLVTSTKEVLLIFGCFIYGRVTIATIALSFIYLFLFTKNKRTVFKTSLISIILISIVFYAIFNFGMNDHRIYKWYNWAFEGFINFFEKGEFTTNSSSNLLNNMYFKVDLKTFLLGDGLYTVDGRYYQRTDVGFLRPLLFFGIFGVFSNYYMLISLIKGLISTFNKLKIKQASIFMLIVLLNVIAFELKGESFHRFLYSLLPLYFITNSEQNKKYKVD